MPLLLKSLPLSLATFWHYIVTLPFLVIVAFLLTLSCLVPILGYFSPGTVTAFCMMVGLRCALTARGHGNTPDFSALLRASQQFSVMNMIVTFVIGLGTIGLLVAIVIGRSRWGLDASGPSNFLVWFGGGAIATYLVLLCLYSTAVAVPMTAAAVAATERGPSPSPIFGLGAGMFSLMFVKLVWMFGGMAIAFFDEVTAVFFSLIMASTGSINGDRPPLEWDIDIFNLVAATLFMIWASSWFYATAVLAWENATKHHEQADVAASGMLRVSGDDLRALREARKQRQRGALGS